MKLCHAVIAGCIAVLACAGSVRAENWPQWRGPHNDGISTETNIPTEWDETKNVVWKFKLPGMGESTPVVWGNKIFLTCEDGNDLVMMCVGTDGKELWKKKLGSGKDRFRNIEGNNAGASPSTDGKHVWAFVSSGELGCFDLDGKEVWKFNVQERYGKFKIQFGYHSTPVLYKDRLYLQIIHSGAALVVALDKATGNEVWKVKRQSDGRAECEHSYASPCIWEKGDDAYLIAHGNDYATAHRLIDGSEIWRLGDLNPKATYDATLRFVSSPVATPDLIIVPSAKKGPTVAVKPDAKGLIKTGSEGEQWRLMKNTPDVPSPLVYDGIVYLCRETGNLVALDAKTGKEIYIERTKNGLYRSSPVLADGKIYLTCRDQGIVTVVEAGPKFKVVASNKLNDQFAACPAISGGRIYLRGYEYLYAIGAK